MTITFHVPHLLSNAASLKGTANGLESKLVKAAAAQSKVWPQSASQDKYDCLLLIIHDSNKNSVSKVWRQKNLPPVNTSQL
jgi:hypothetical protein